MRTLQNPASLSGLLPGGRKTAVLFILPHCPYCKAFRPVFESFAAVKAGDPDCLTVVLEDDENPLWDEYGINVVPTVILFEGQKILTRLDGRPGQGLSAADLEHI